MNQTVQEAQELADKITKDANEHAAQTRIVAAFEASQIIQRAIDEANEIKLQANPVPAGELTPECNKS